MAKLSKTRKFAAVKRMISKNDPRLKTNIKPEDRNKLLKLAADKRKEREERTGKSSNPNSDAKKIDGAKIQRVAKASSSLFFRYNTQLGPPYRILVDTNFINFAIQNKLDLFTAMMDCLLAKCIPIVTDCVMAELEKLGPKYRGMPMCTVHSRTFPPHPPTHNHSLSIFHFDTDSLFVLLFNCIYVMFAPFLSFSCFAHCQGP